jgi:hypothetical protein
VEFKIYARIFFGLYRSLKALQDAVGRVDEPHEIAQWSALMMGFPSGALVLAAVSEGLMALDATRGQRDLVAVIVTAIILLSHYRLLAAPGVYQRVLGKFPNDRHYVYSSAILAWVYVVGVTAIGAYLLMP